MCVKCGIRDYDNLPGRVGLIDVDAVRYALGENIKRVELLKQRLDKAVILNKQKGEKGKKKKKKYGKAL